MLLKVEGLGVTYGTRESSVRVVRGVSFAIRPGEAFGLLGESGSGKSTVALATLGLLPPGTVSEGSIRFGDVEVIGASEDVLRSIRGAQVSFVPQEPLQSLNPVLRAIDQVVEVLRAHVKLSNRERRERAGDALRQAGLRDQRLHEAYPHQMSGGERQRVLIAQAIVCRPRVLIADESTGSLDGDTEREILALLRALVEQLEVSLFLITHDPGVLAAVANRVLVMYAGRIVESGPAAEVLRSPRHPYTRGLLRSVLDGTRKESGANRRHVPAIPGAPPDFRLLPPGCAFEPRCEDRMKCCSESEPAAVVKGSCEVSCFLYAQS